MLSLGRTKDSIELLKMVDVDLENAETLVLSCKIEEELIKYITKTVCLCVKFLFNNLRGILNTCLVFCVIIILK